MTRGTLNLLFQGLMQFGYVTGCEGMQLNHETVDADPLRNAVQRELNLVRSPRVPAWVDITMVGPNCITLKAPCARLSGEKTSMEKIAAAWAQDHGEVDVSGSYEQTRHDDPEHDEWIITLEPPASLEE